MRNGLNSLRRAVAARLLCLGLVVSSCLLPQNDDPLPVIPPAKNRPPRIVLEQVKPPRFIPVNLGLDIGEVCEDPKVEVTVEDLDVEMRDRIRLRWTVYEANGTRGLRQIDDPPPIESTGTVRRPTITAPSVLFKLTSLGNSGKGRRLELVVADGEFIIRNDKLDTIPLLVPGPDGGFISDPTYLDSYSWVVDSEMQQCP